MLCDADKIIGLRSIMQAWNDAINAAVKQHDAQEIGDAELECVLACASESHRRAIINILS
jgi:hypothetical protein